MFYDRLKSICKRINKTPTAIAKEVTNSGSNAAHWKKGSLPSCEIIVKLSKRLGVSCDYLLLGNEKADDLTPKQHELLSLFNKLNDQGIEQLIGFATGLTMATEFVSNGINQAEGKTSVTKSA